MFIYLIIIIIYKGSHCISLYSDQNPNWTAASERLVIQGRAPPKSESRSPTQAQGMSAELGIPQDKVCINYHDTNLPAIITA